MIYLKHKNGIAIILLIIAILPYIYLSFYCHPAADDYTYAVKGRQITSVFDALLYEYLNWNGRYSSNILVLVNPIINNGFKTYQFIPILLVISMIVSFYSFLYAIIGEVFNKVKIFLFSLFFTVAYLYGMPQIAEGLYWYTGAVTYLLGCIFALFYFSLMIKFFRKRYLINGFFHFILLLIILIFIIGLNEVLMIFLICVHLLLLAFNYNKKEKGFLKTIFIIGLIASLVVVFSPGNNVRSANFTENHMFFNSLLMTVLQTIRFSMTWILSPVVLFGSLLFIPISKKLEKPGAILFQNIKPYMTLVFLFIIPFICIFPAYWSTGILGQHRTVNVAYFFFLLFWFINLHLFLNKYRTMFNKIFTNKWIYISSFCLLYLGVLFTNNGFDSINDIYTQKAKAFDVQMIERYEILNNCNKEEKQKCYLPPIKNKPSCLFIIDIKEDQNHWVNLGYGLFYEIDGYIYKN